MVALLGLLGGPVAAAVRGEPAAVEAARRLVENAGGAAAWRARTFEVRETGYLRSGEVVELRIVRDFVAGARRLERVAASGTFVEWLAPGEGWTRRGDAVSPIAAEELAIELQGLRQEPYAIYHRLAHDDGRLRVELRGGGATLVVYDEDERVLCWFLLAADGDLHGWGNFWNGTVNQHFYGPTTDFGDANLPRWGVAVDGSFRFEYRGAELRETPLARQAGDPPGS